MDCIDLAQEMNGLWALVKVVTKFEVQNLRLYSRIAVDLLALQEGLCSVEFICNKFDEITNRCSYMQSILLHC